MGSPIVTLTSDFGLRDPFVGIMKGVILGICPGARLVDLTHEVTAYDVGDAALALESAVGFFPRGTVHLAVVDPGVGSARRAMALRRGDHYFVGPDNGLFTFAIAEYDWSAVSLEARAFRLPAVSRTFHGRDVFAPAAAHLAAGIPLERLGPPLSDPVRLPRADCRRIGDQLIGEVIGSDRFGNLVTSVTADAIERLGASGGLHVAVAGRSLGPLKGSYAEGRPGVPAGIIASNGRLEIFANGGNARALLGAERGTPVRVERSY
jgi:S-adenosyl-L-methionine hydrolase (adenosine-forming)